MSKSRLAFSIGDLVEVEARTWPGINKSGGIGRIFRLDEQEEAIDVNYVLGGKEKNIPIQYVSLAESYQESGDGLGRRTLRDRSMLLGRCRTCGSLRQDCGSCDWAKEAQEQNPRLAMAQNSTEISNPKVGLLLPDETDTSSSDDDSILMPERSLRRVSRNKSGSYEDSSSSDDDGLFHILYSSRRRKRMQRNISFLDQSVHETDPKQLKRKRDNASNSRNEKENKLVAAIADKGMVSCDFASMSTIRSNSNLVSLNRLSQDVPRERLTEMTPEKVESSQKKQNRVKDVDGYKTLHSKPWIRDWRKCGNEYLDEDDFDDVESSQIVYDNSSQKRHVKVRSRTLSVLQPEHMQNDRNVSETMLFDDDLGGFIQPEGAATSLPSDTMDKTRGLPFLSLPSFFSKTLQKVQDLLPEAYAAFDDVQHRVATRRSVGATWEDLEEEAWILYESTKENLVLNRLDQCRIVGQRLSSRVEYRKYKATMTNRQKRHFTEAASNARDFAFDQIEDEVENFLKNLRDYLFNLKDCQNENNDEIGDIDSDEEHDEEIEVRRVPDISSASEEGIPGVDRNTPFDPHMHATRVRKPKNLMPATFHLSNTSKRRKKKISDDFAPSHGGNEPYNDPNEDAPYQIEGKEEELSSNCPVRRLKTNESLSEIDKFIVGAQLGAADVETKHFDSDDDQTLEIGENTTPHDTEDSSIPCLEAILPTKKSATQRSLKRYQRANATYKNKKKSMTASERMEAFLDKNSLSIDNHGDYLFDGHEELDSIDTAKRPKKDMKSSRDEMQDFLIFENLKNIPTQIRSPLEINSNARLLESLNMFRASYNILCGDEEKIIREIIRTVKRGNNSISRDGALLIFSVANRYFLKNCTTLQELIIMKDSNLLCHLKAICSILMILEMNIQKKLKPSDGVLFKLFASDVPCPFVQIVILQFLDVLFAFFHPQAWASNGKAYEEINIMECFAPLRDSISATVSLLELSCQYMLSKLECQRWFKARCGSYHFISSIDPAMYQKILETGEMPKTSSSEVRIKLLGSKLPRKEIEVIWSIVGYLAGAKTKVEPKISKSRWRLLFFLICCDTGVLPKALEGKEKSIVTEQHAKRCELELSYLTLLVHRGDMSPLANSDKLLTIYMKRAIFLQTRRSYFNDFCGLFCLEECSIDQTVLQSHWDASDLLRVSNPNATEACINNELTSLSLILKSAVKLLREWVRKATSSPVLLSQLASSFREIEHLGKRVCNDGQSEDQFAKAFAANKIPNFILIASLQVLMAFDFFRNSSASQAGKTVFTTKALSQLWCQTSSQDMKIYQKSLMELQPVRKRSAIGISSFFLCFATMRAICCFTFGHLGMRCGHSDDDIVIAAHINHNRLDRPQAPYQYILRKAFSCIMTALEGMCKSTKTFTTNTPSETPKVQARALTVSLIWISQIISYCRYIHNMRDSEMFQQQLLSEVKSVGENVFNLSYNALRSCLLTILSNASNEKMDFSFRACLTVIRCAAAWASDIFMASSKPEQNDEFGDFDDSVFLNIEPCAASTESPAKNLCTLIRQLLELGDPSKRYDIQTNIAGIPDDFADSVRSRGRLMISRFSGGLCSCLAALVAVLGEECHLDDLIMVAKKVLDPTEQFARNCSVTFMSETCKLARKYSLCKDFIEKRFEKVLLNFFVALLDAGSIERFPSCDVRAINKLAGAKGARRERRYLSMMNDREDAFQGIGMKRGEEIDEVGPIYTSTNIWYFYDCILEIAESRVDCAMSQLISSMEPFDPSVFDRNGHLPRSIELECMKRLYLLQLFFKAPADKLMLESMEDLLLLVLKVAISNILQISDGLLYLHTSQTKSKKGKSPSHKHGKLKLLLAIYLDMFLATLSSIVLIQWEQYSDSFKTSISVIRDGLLFRVAQSDETNIEELFRKFCSIKSRQLPSGSQGTSATAMLDLRVGVKIACIRRCREIVNHLSISSDGRSGVIAMLISISSLNNGRLSTEMATSLFSRSFYSYDTRHEPGYNLLVFEEHVDKSMMRLTMFSREIALKELRKFLLTQVLPPRMRNARFALSCKLACVHLANKFLQKEMDEKIQRQFLNWNHIHGIMRSNWEVILEHLNAGNFSHDLIAQSFRCMSLVMGLPFDCFGGTRSRPLLHWCYGELRKLMAGDGFEQSQDFSDIHVFVFYTLTLAMIMKYLANIFVISSSETIRDKMYQVSKLAVSPMSGKDVIRLPSFTSFDIKTALQELHSCNKVLLTNKDKATSIVENVYTKNTRTSAGKESIGSKDNERSKLQREANNLIAVISSAFSNS